MPSLTSFIHKINSGEPTSPVIPPLRASANRRRGRNCRPPTYRASPPNAPPSQAGADATRRYDVARAAANSRFPTMYRRCHHHGVSQGIGGWECFLSGWLLTQRMCLMWNRCSSTTSALRRPRRQIAANRCCPVRERDERHRRLSGDEQDVAGLRARPSSSAWAGQSHGDRMFLPGGWAHPSSSRWHASGTPCVEDPAVAREVSRATSKAPWA